MESVTAPIKMLRKEFMVSTTVPLQTKTMMSVTTKMLMIEEGDSLPNDY